MLPPSETGEQTFLHLAAIFDRIELRLVQCCTTRYTVKINSRRFIAVATHSPYFPPVCVNFTLALKGVALISILEWLVHF